MEKEVIHLEKTYVIATLIFGWFITISLIVFTFFAFRLGYALIGLATLAITAGSAAMNTLLMRKWKITS